MEGLALAHQWSELPVLIQTDCAEAITVMKCTGKNRSAYGHLIDEIKHLLNIRDNVLMKIERGQNWRKHQLLGASYTSMYFRTVVG
jgi:hypothetical protein